MHETVYPSQARPELAPSAQFSDFSMRSDRCLLIPRRGRGKLSHPPTAPTRRNLAQGSSWTRCAPRPRPRAVGPSAWTPPAAAARTHSADCSNASARCCWPSPPAAATPAPRAKAGESDLVQDSLLEGQQDFPAFRGESPDELLAWLKQILAHNLANFRRRYRGAEMRTVRREQEFAAAAGEPGRGRRGHAGGDGREAGGTRPGSGRHRRGLPAAAREVVVWPAQRDALSFEEIGERTGRTPGRRSPGALALARCISCATGSAARRSDWPGGSRLTRSNPSSRYPASGGR